MALGDYVCHYCGKEFTCVYKNKGGIDGHKGYWGSGQRYNWRAPAANFKRHEKACKNKEKKQ